MDEFAEVAVAHVLFRGMGVVWVDEGDGVCALWPPPLISLFRCVSQLNHLEGLPTAVYKGAGSVEPASFIVVIGHRFTPGVYVVRPATASCPQPVDIIDSRYSVNYALHIYKSHAFIQCWQVLSSLCLHGSFSWNAIYLGAEC